MKPSPEPAKRPAEIRLVVIIEAATVTGPAKNLIRFCTLAANPPPGETPVRSMLVTFERGRPGSARPEAAFAAAVRQAGLELRIIPEAFRMDPAVVPRLSKTIADHDPDIVQSHGVKSHFLVRLCALPKRSRWIAFHHGYTAVDRKMLLYNQLDRWSLRAPRRIVTVCRPFAEELARIGVPRAKIEILPNSIEPVFRAPTEQIEAQRRRFAIEPGERVILCIGRLSREKGHADLIAGGAHLRKLQPGLRFRILIAGDGPERRELEELASSLGCAVTFAGHVQDVKPLFGLAGVFVLPSHSEGSPNVLLEAMAAGVPIVATDVGGVPETVRDESTALLVPARRPDLLAARIARLIEDPALAAALRANGEAAVAERSPEQYRRALARIYCEVAGARLSQMIRSG